MSHGLLLMIWTYFTCSKKTSNNLNLSPRQNSESKRMHIEYISTNPPVLTQVGPLMTLTGHNIYGFEISKRIPIFWVICHQNWSTRWRSRVFFRFLFLWLHSATTCLPHVVCRSPETSDQELSDDVWLIRLTSSMTSQSKYNLFRFSVVFLGSAYANDHLRQKVGYENDGKNMENLLDY